MLKEIFRAAKFLFVLLFVVVFLTGLVNFVNAFSIPDKSKRIDKSKRGDKGVYHNGIIVTLATPAAECGICHQKEFHEWRFALGSDLDSAGKGTYHALSSTEEMYTTMLNVVSPEFHFYCKGCHESGNPWSVMDRVNGMPEARTQNIEEGINCVVCHYDGNWIVRKEELKDSLFCATCHNEGNSFTDTYIEWLNDYKGKKTCQQCHMKKDSHLFIGLHSTSLVRDAIDISEPLIPERLTAGIPFEIQFNLTNYGAGHSVPVDLLRNLKVRVSIVNSSNIEIGSHERSFYKRFAFFGENPSETEVIRAGETKSIIVQNVVYYPGIYTLKIELLQNLNRLGITNSTIFMGSKYKTFTIY